MSTTLNAAGDEVREVKKRGRPAGGKNRSKEVIAAEKAAKEAKRQSKSEARRLAEQAQVEVPLV